MNALIVERDGGFFEVCGSTGSNFRENLYWLSCGKWVAVSIRRRRRSRFSTSERAIKAAKEFGATSVLHKARQAIIVKSPHS